MLCHIYRSSLKLDTYLYLPVKDDFSELPESLLKVFGVPEFSFSFDLSTDRKLAKEDTHSVVDNLQNQGYHLQLQNDELIEAMDEAGLNESDKHLMNNLMLNLTPLTYSKRE